MNWKRKVFFCMALVLCLGTVACSGPLFKAYGRIDPSAEAAVELEGYKVNPDYNYYISGPDLHPNALIGLDKKYRIDPSTFWRELEVPAVQLKQIVNGMKSKAFEHRMFPHGFAMFDNNGRQIGLWYSILEGRTYLRMNEDGTVRIATPDLDLFMRLENDGRDG